MRLVFIMTFCVGVVVEGKFVNTTHAKVERWWPVNEADCGLVRLPLQPPSECFRGRAKTTLRSKYRVAGGQPAADHEFPWVVALIEVEFWWFKRFFCTGSIVNKRWVLTAAHCVDGLNPSNLEIQVGSSLLDKSSGRIYRAERIEIFKEYKVEDKYMVFHDLALIQTREEIEYTIDAERHVFTVNSICLPKNFQENDDDEWAHQSGVGFISNDKIMPTTLQKTGGVIAGLQRGGAGSDILFDSNDAQLCKGDSGSPLFQYDGRRAVLIGVGKGGKLPPPEVDADKVVCSSRTIFTRVSTYTHWFFYPFLGDEL